MIYTIDHCEPDGKKKIFGWFSISADIFAADYFAGKGGGKIRCACAEGFGSPLKDPDLTFAVWISTKNTQTAKQRYKGLQQLTLKEFPPELTARRHRGFETIEHLDDGEILLTKLYIS